MNQDKYLTKQTLLLRAKDPNDHEAWEEFVEFYKRFIYHILHKMNINTNDFDDLVQVVLVRLWEGLKSYERQDCKFRTWLSTVTKNTVLNYLDKQQRQIKRQEKLAELQDLQRSLDSFKLNDLEALIENEWRSYVSSRALENIKDSFSGVAIEAFVLSQKEGLSAEDIGERLEIKKESVYVLVSRVKSKFVTEIKHLINEMEVH